MAFSYTGLAYLIGFFALGLLSYRFFQYWQKERTTTAKLFFYFTSVFTLMMLITAIAGLFFVLNNQILKILIFLTVFTQNIGLSICGSLIIHLKFPRISPWWGFLIVFFLGLVAFVLSISIPFSPYLEENGGVDWDVPPLLGMLRFFIFLITFLPLTVIFIQQIRTSKEPLIKKRALGLSLVLVFGIVAALSDFFLETILKLNTISSDIAMIIVGLVALIVIFFTQKPPPEEKYVSPPPAPKIPW
jgi:hypothetical protein